MHIHLHILGVSYWVFTCTYDIRLLFPPQWRPTPQKSHTSPTRIRHLRTSSSPRHPGTDTGEDPIIIRRVKLGLSILQKPSFHHVTNPTSVTYPFECHLFIVVVDWWTKGNRSLTPVRGPTRSSVHHPPSCRWVGPLPSNSPKRHCVFFVGGVVNGTITTFVSTPPLPLSMSL